MTPNQQREISKYVQAYSQTSYGMGGARRNAAERHVIDWWMETARPFTPTLVDVGCGRGEMVDFANATGFIAKGIDPATSEIIDKSDIEFGMATNIPFPDKYANVVTCFDVMEHLLEEDLRPALLEMQRVASDAIIIAAADFPHFGPNNVNYHISFRKDAEWQTLFASVFPWVQMLPRYGSISSTWLCRP